jgi:hypothetical protein
MIENIIKYRRNILTDLGLYISLFIPLFVFFLLSSSKKILIFNKENVATTSFAIITLSIAFCYQAFNNLKEIDTKDPLYKKLLKTEILDEIRFLYSYNIIVGVSNILFVSLFTFLVWFKIVDEYYLFIFSIITFIFTLYTLSEFINFFKTGIGLKKYKLDFEKIDSRKN